MQDFKKLVVWQKAHQLTLEVYRQTKSFPADERFGLTSQLRRAAASIEANLAEGTGRGTDLDFARFVQIAMGSAAEVECHLLVARDLGILGEEPSAKMLGQVVEVKRMLASLLKKLKADG